MKDSLETRLRNRARCNAEAAHDTAAMLYGLEAAKGAKKAEEYLEWLAADELSLRSSRIEELEKALDRAKKDLRYALDWGINGGFNDEDESFLRQGLAVLLSAHPDKEEAK